jgi:hypothetical protein
MPWAAGIYNYNSANNSKYDPEGYCLPPGGPRLMATPYPMEILQLPEQKRVFMIFEGATHIWREIYLDGRPHPHGDDLNPTYLGHSVGRWDGDTLVVDVVGSTRRPGSTTTVTRTPTSCTSSERFSRPTSARCTTRRRSTIRGHTRSRSRSGGIFRGTPAASCRCICQRTTNTWRLTDDLGQPIVGKSRSAGRQTCEERLPPRQETPELSACSAELCR